MIKHRTTIVVGAGASHDLGLPLGETLKFQIQSLLSVSTYSQAIGGLQRDSYSKEYIEVREAAASLFKDKGWNASLENINDKFKIISENVVRAASIDNFLDHHQHDKELVACGKLAIAYCIAKGEDSAQLEGSPKLDRCLKDKKGKVINNSYFLEEFMKLVVRNHTIDDIERSLKNLTFVIFNYDRCIERYLDLWLSAIFVRPCWDLIKNNVNFIHVYGQLNPYDGDKFSLATGPSGYLFMRSKDELPSISNGLRIFSEQKEDKVFREIDSAMENTEALIFVGFGYEEQNMEFFQSSSLIQLNVFGTAFGFSKDDREQISSEIASSLKIGQDYVFLDDCRGADLFNAFSRRIKKAIGSR